MLQTSKLVLQRFTWKLSMKLPAEIRPKRGASTALWGTILVWGQVSRNRVSLLLVEALHPEISYWVARLSLLGAPPSCHIQNLFSTCSKKKGAIRLKPKRNRQQLGNFWLRGLASGEIHLHLGRDERPGVLLRPGGTMTIKCVNCSKNWPKRRDHRRNLIVSQKEIVWFGRFFLRWCALSNDK